MSVLVLRPPSVRVLVNGVDLVPLRVRFSDSRDGGYLFEVDLDVRDAIVDDPTRLMLIALEERAIERAREEIARLKGGAA